MMFKMKTKSDKNIAYATIIVKVACKFLFFEESLWNIFTKQEIFYHFTLLKSLPIPFWFINELGHLIA